MFNESSMRNALFGGLAVGLSLILSGCAGKSEIHETAGGTTSQDGSIAIVDSQAGPTPFIDTVEFAAGNAAQVQYVEYSIAPKPNTVSAPVDVTWSRSALISHGYLSATLASAFIKVPVFGLYAGYQNQVSFKVGLDDGFVRQLDYKISTQSYLDSTGIYLNPTIVKARAPDSELGFNFFILKSQYLSPVIVDTDGQVRWVAPATPTPSVYYTNGQFVTGSTSSPTVTDLTLAGTSAPLATILPQPLLNTFTHNIDPGPSGLLAEFSGTDDLGSSDDDIVAEIALNPGQPPFQVFDMADILTDYMKKNGDDPTQFVRPGADWFHVNASTYDPSDNSVIVSSRENFLIKVDYSTHDIIWILGDPTKYWYTFPSLRAKALTLDAGGNYPIGQHGVSITSDGYIMVFNDGLGSANQPTGEPGGLSRTYSEVSAYSVNTLNMTAHEVWGFDYGKTLYSPICGSSYEVGNSYLVDFATAANYTEARLVGLDSNHNVIFDFQYQSPAPCGAAWNAIPIPMEDLQIDK
jgi:arylsulfate sulfotransferase